VPARDRTTAVLAGATIENERATTYSTSAGSVYP